MRWVYRTAAAVAMATPPIFVLATRSILLEDVFLALVTAVTFPILALVILERQPGQGVAIAYLVFGVMQTVAGFGYSYAERTYTTGDGSNAFAAVGIWVGTWVWAVGTVSLATFGFLLFPDGRLPSAGWRWVGRLAGAAIASLVVAGIAILPEAGPALLGDDPRSPLALGAFHLGLSLAAVAMLLSVLSVFIRFRRAADVERQQIKWLLAAEALLVGGLLMVFLGPDPLGEVVGVAGVVAVPVASAVAIVRYRLYDIDLIINRALVYSTLTGVLVGAYALGVLVFRTRLDPVTGDNDLAIAASTLAVAALFGPSRRRIQTFFDRRFYRSRYDAKQTLEAFAARLRDKVDLDAVSAELLQVVLSTVHRRHASVWLPREGVL